jgi:methylglutaconyl-CoA hydratase
MIADLTSAFRGLAVRDDIRAVLLRGLGPAFSAGADARWMRASLEFSVEENMADALRMADMFAAIDETPQPVIAQVHGACLGGGTGLIAVCDIVLAAADALFGFTETRLGIIPAVISSFVVPRIGASWARALFPTGERFGPEVAQRIGLVHWIAPAGELEAATNEKLAGIRAGGPGAVRAAKALVTELYRPAQDGAREETARRIAALRTSPEGQEGLRAFLEKRAPLWREDA